MVQQRVLLDLPHNKTSTSQTPMENRRTSKELGITELSLPTVLTQHAFNSVNVTEGDPAAHVYKHVFGNGVKATAKICLNPPSIKVQWEGRPTRKLFPEYCVWRKTITEDVYKRTGVKIAVVDLC